MVIAWLLLVLLLGLLGGFMLAQHVAWPLSRCALLMTVALFCLLPRGAGVLLPAAALLAAAMPVLHTRYGFAADRRIVRRVPDGVALTFDDGPSPATTPRLLEVLAEHGVHATFFLIGEKVVQHPDLARRIVEAGHEIGVHGFSHRPLALLPVDQIEQELRRTRAAITEATGVVPRYVRAPWGFFTREVLDCLRADEKMVQWTHSTRDWTAPGVETLAARISGMARPGSILLLHDGAHDGSPREQTPAALAQALPALQHLRFVLLSE